MNTQTGIAALANAAAPLPPSPPKVRRSGLKSLTCLQCGEKFMALSRKFCCDDCRKAYEFERWNQFAGIPGRCSQYRANIDYYGSPDL